MQNHTVTQTIETARLILRPFKKDDFEAVHSYASVPENVKYMVWGPNDEEATRKFLSGCEEKWRTQPIYEYDFAIVSKSDIKVIGGCGIYLNKERTEAMLGWILHRDYWKQGLMVEAASELLRFGFEELKLHRIYSTCSTENYGSYRVMEKLGVRREAHFLKNRFGRLNNEKKWYDEYHYAMLEDDWAI
jgi:RimJ/RimL family protein N-acetyltransferase